MTKVMIAAAQLECESLLMLSRSKLLCDDYAGFLVHLTEALVKLEVLRDALVNLPTADYALAAGTSPSEAERAKAPAASEAP